MKSFILLFFLLASCDFSVETTSDENDDNYEDAEYEYYENDSDDSDDESSWFWDWLFGSDEDECPDNPPENGTITVALSINDKNPVVTFRVYRETIENGKSIWVQAVSKRHVAVKVPNGEYAVEVDYRVTLGGKERTVTVVNGGDVSYEETSNYNNGNCYKRGNLNLDLTLDESLYD